MSAFIALLFVGDRSVSNQVANLPVRAQALTGQASRFVEVLLSALAAWSI